MNPARRAWKTGSAAVATAAALLALTACSSSGLQQQYADGSTKNYIAGDGSVVEIAPQNREAPVTFQGRSDAGTDIRSRDYDGDVLVVNFWYASCPPCRVEAPALRDLSEKYDSWGVSFLGVNVRDQAETSTAFARSFDIKYPSILDANDSTMQLAFAGKVAPNAVPSTLVIDKQGRVAARVTGRVDKSTLEALIRTGIEEVVR